MGTQGFEKEIVFLSGKRTPFGTFGGSLKDFTATDLGAHSANAALEAAGSSRAGGSRLLRQCPADLRRRIYLARHVGLRRASPTKRGHSR